MAFFADVVVIHRPDFYTNITRNFETTNHSNSNIYMRVHDEKIADYCVRAPNIFFVICHVLPFSITT